MLRVNAALAIVPIPLTKIDPQSVGLQSHEKSVLLHSGYEIWFHQLVNDISNQLDPQAQENILITDLAPSDTVKLSYDDGVLPDTLYTGEKLLQNALKGGVTYRVATIAFTERQVGIYNSTMCLI